MGLEPIASRLQGERTTIVLSRRVKGRVLIGSTRNPTSTSEVHVPFATDIQPVHYAPYCSRSPVLLVAFLASEERVRRTRDCDFFSFPMSSYSPATSDPGVEPVLASEPLVLGKVPFVSFRRAKSIPHPAWFGREIRSRHGVFTDYPTDKGLVATRRGSQLNPHPILVTHGYETPAFRWLLHT